MEKEDLRRLLEEILKKDGTSAPDTKGMGTEDAAKALKEFGERLRKETAELTKAQPKTKIFTDLISSGGVKLRDLSGELESLEKKLQEATEAGEGHKVALYESQKAALQEAQVRNKTNEAVLNFGGGLTKILSSTILEGAINFVKGLQSGQSGVELYGNAAKTAAKGTTDSIAMIGDVAGSAGSALSTIPGPVGNVAKAFAVLGPVISKLAGYFGKVSQEGLDLLQKEVQKTQKAFADASSSGALFADGMSGVRNSAHKTGLTVEQFSNVLKNNSTTLAASGLGVSEGAKRIGAAMEAGGEGAKKQLMNLGYSFEEQASMYAQVAADMNKNSMGRKATDGQIAEQTMKYADNLRTIAAITGEDGKKKMEQARQEANQLAFRQKLAKLPLEQQEATKRAMANMSDIERKNFMDMVNFGSVINKEGAIYEATVDGAADKTAQALASFNAGTLDGAEQQKRNAEFSDRINKGIMEGNEALGTAAAVAGSSLSSLAESMSKQVDFNNTYTESAVKAAQETLNSQKNTTDALTNSVNNIELSAQKMKVSLEENLGPAITKYSNQLIEAAESVEAMLKRLGLKEKTGSESAGGVVGGLAGAAGGAAAGAAIGSVVPVIGTLAGGIIGALLGGYGGMTAGEKVGGAMGSSSMPKGATGGIFSGPDSGYPVLMHGVEAITPIQNASTGDASGNIGTGTKVSELPGDSSGMTSAITALISNMQDQLSKQDEMIRILADNRDYTQRLMQSMN